jgi:hypothetical protein
VRTLVGRAVVGVGVITAILAVPGVAWAGWGGSASAGLKVSSGTLAPVQTVSTSAKCARGNPRVTVSWSASSTTSVTGYTVTLDPTGPGATITDSVSGRTTTQDTVSISTGPTYAISVVAVQSAWTSAATKAAAAVQCG